MTHPHKFDTPPIEECIRRQISLEQGGRNVPPQLRPAGLAATFNKTVPEVMELIRLIKEK